MFIRYPELPELPYDLQDDPRVREYHRLLREWWGAVINELEVRDRGTFYGAAGVSVYSLTSVSAIRDFNPGGGSDSYTANRLATLLYDLQQKGIIS